MTDIDETEIRDRILLATLPNVAFDGWTDRTLDHGVEEAGYSPDMAFRAFPGGVGDVIRHWSVYGDRRMRQQMAAFELSSMPFRTRVATAIRVRIEVYEAHREAVRRTLAHLALPGNVGIAAGNVARTVNAIWYAAGDRSADFTYYTKRAALLPVYVATVLYWLDAESEGSAATWSFLDRRLDNILSIPNVGAQLRDRLGRLGMPLRRMRPRGGLRRAGRTMRRGHA